MLVSTKVSVVTSDVDDSDGTDDGVVGDSDGSSDEGSIDIELGSPLDGSETFPSVV